MPHAKIPKSFDSLSEAMTHLQIETAAEAKRALASDPDKLHRIEEMLKSWGL